MGGSQREAILFYSKRLLLCAVRSIVTSLAEPDPYRKGESGNLQYTDLFHWNALTSLCQRGQYKKYVYTIV